MLSATSSIEIEFLTKDLQSQHLCIWTLEGIVQPFLLSKWYPFGIFCFYSIQKNRRATALQKNFGHVESLNSNID